MAETCLVTGGAGWLGLNLVKRLSEEGYRVRCLIEPGQPMPDEPFCRAVDWLPGDVRSARDCENFCLGAEGATLFHLAGIIHPRRAAQFEEINHQGTVTLVGEAARMGLRKAVIMSSNSPCGCNPRRDHRFDEKSPYHPYMGYGRSKMRMEQSVQSRFPELDWTLIRAPWFYGPFQPPRQSLFFRMVRDGKAPIVGDGNNFRSMSYTDNLVQGLVLAARKEEARQRTFWIADAEPYTMNQIVDTIEAVLREDFGIACKGKRMRLPALASDVAERVDAALQSVGLYHQKIHVLSEMNKTIACDVSLAREVLGYQPQVALREGMRRSLEWVMQRYGKL